jgi:exopolyphosphatase/guanosine-5'-triphosphate,3'-diphosphate pyrophosphatase
MQNPRDLISQNILAHYPNIAAIDLGTNSCRLLVASVSIVNIHRNFFKLRAIEDEPFRVVDSFARVVGLGEGLNQTGVLSKSAIDKAIDALRVCKHKIDVNNVSKMRAVATEACRKGGNSGILINRAKEELDLSIEVISPQEEAQLVLRGCMSELSSNYSYGIALDIGGGSTEVIWLRIKKDKMSLKLSTVIIDSMSLPYGVVTLRDTYIHENSSAETYVAAQQAMSQAVKFFIAKNGIRTRIKNNEVQVIASSGTVTTLASLALNLESYDRKMVDGQDFKTIALQNVGNSLLSQFLNKCPSSLFLRHRKTFLMERITDGKLPTKEMETLFRGRLGLLAAGTVIFNTILDVIGLDTVRIADRGVREGILNEIIEQLKNSQETSQRQ